MNGTMRMITDQSEGVKWEQELGEAIDRMSASQRAAIKYENALQRGVSDAAQAASNALWNLDSAEMLEMPPCRVQRERARLRNACAQLRRKFRYSDSAVGRANID